MIVGHTKHEPARQWAAKVLPLLVRVPSCPTWAHEMKVDRG
jgi:hypothetical protein